MEKLEFSHIAGGNVNDALEDSLEMPQKLIIKLSYDQAIPILGMYTRNKNLCPQKNLYMNVYSNIIHNSQLGETTQISTN